MIIEGALTITDTVIKSATKRRYIAETALLTTDTIAGLKKAVRRIDETVAITDALTRVANKKRYIAETALTITDSVTRLKKAVRRINESVSISDSVVRRLFAFRRITEPRNCSYRCSNRQVSQIPSNV